MPARLAHDMAHNEPTPPSRGSGYYLKGGPGGLPLIQLRRFFLNCVPAVCPQAFDDYRNLLPWAREARLAQDANASAGRRLGALSWRLLEDVTSGEVDSEALLLVPEAVRPLVAFHDALFSWASQYYLRADWVLQGAVEQLTLSVSTGLGPYLAPAIDGYAPIAPPLPRFVFSYRSWDEDLDIEAYRANVEGAVKKALDVYLQEAERRLANPKVVKAEYMDKRSYAALVNGAQWQTTGTTGEAGKSSDRTIRKWLKHIGLKPRPGLKH